VAGKTGTAVSNAAKNVASKVSTVVKSFTTAKPPRPEVLRVDVGQDRLVLPAVPKGALGTPVTTGRGLEYAIPPGTAELDPRVAYIRIMDPVTSGPYQYPNGYAVYMNQLGQTVNPLTGRTISPADPLSHIVFK
jgi:hypothetical protein